MADELTLEVNGAAATVAVSPETPLLYALTNDLGLLGPRFGCGLGQCGACSVLVDGVEMRSCITPTSTRRRQIGHDAGGTAGLLRGAHESCAAPELHPLQEAMIAEQAAQCGYCFNGQIIKGAELLFKRRSRPTSRSASAMNGHICRCGMYPRIMAAIRRAANAMAEAANA